LVKTKQIVDISDAKVSSDPQDVLVTYSLGSCIGVSLYDPGVRVGSLFHFQLPSASLHPDKAESSPFMFADTGMNLILSRLSAMGINLKRLKVRVAGGANMQTGPRGFDIGKRNYLAIRKLLWQRGMFIDAEDVGGSTPRNMYLDIADGSVLIRAGGTERQL
jgi:chemotaxis protein CheD